MKISLRPIFTATLLALLFLSSVPVNAANKDKDKDDEKKAKAAAMKRKEVEEKERAQRKKEAEERERAEARRKKEAEEKRRAKEREEKKIEEAAVRAAAKFDENHNGIIDGEEIDAIDRAFSATPKGPLRYYDSNHDGRFNKAEIGRIKIHYPVK